MSPRRMAAVAAAATLIALLPTIERTAAAPGDFPWRTVGGRITSSPDMASLPDGSAYFVARGVDGAAWLHVLEPGDTFKDGTWTSLGGKIVGGPTISATAAEEPGEGTGRLDVFAQGIDNALWTRSFSAPLGVWTPWTSLGGILSAEPSSMSFGDPDDTTPPTTLRVAVFVRGNDSAMWYRELIGTAGWTPWSSLGGVLLSGPGAGGHPSSFAGAIAVRGADHAVWYRSYNAATGAFTPWASGGGQTNAAPAAEYFCTPALWARGGDQRLWHTVTQPHTGWVPYGGRARSGPGTHMALAFPAWFATVRGVDDALWVLADNPQFDEAHCGSMATGSGAASPQTTPAWWEELR